jgi:hypothetical protein
MTELSAPLVTLPDQNLSDGFRDQPEHGPYARVLVEQPDLFFETRYIYYLLEKDRRRGSRSRCACALGLLGEGAELERLG